ncbi:MAG: M28 family metallopeptidase, partial [Planctomycetota bacterium]
MPRLSVRLACVVAGFGWLWAAPVAAQFSGAEPVAEALRPGFESITPEQAKSFLEVLAGPQFKGRGTGQVGYTKAAHWVAGKVAEYGLEPRGEGGTFFQMLPMVRLTIDATDSALTGPKNLKLSCDKGISLDRFADQSLVSGKVTFLQIRGANASLPEDLDLRDRVVVFTTDDANAGRAPFLIARKGPALTLRVVEQPVASSSQLLRRDGRTRSTSASGTITRAAASELLTAVDGQAAWLEPLTEDGLKFNSTDAEVALSLRIREESAAVPNVIAWLEGSDPQLKDEYIVIGAHLDHLGERSGNVYYGADDNGSGSTAILSIARALALNPQRPKRSVLFIWFAAEEMGLVGSRHYTDFPTLPLEKMVCMLNIDMVGRNEEKEGETAAENEQTLHLIGSQQGQTALHDIILAANRHLNFTFEYDEEGVFGRSDQASFYNKGIAVAFLFGGFHPDYHQPSDELGRIDFDKISSAARLFYLTAFGVAEHGRIAVT